MAIRIGTARTRRPKRKRVVPCGIGRQRMYKRRRGRTSATRRDRETFAAVDDNVNHIFTIC